MKECFNKVIEGQRGIRNFYALQGSAKIVMTLTPPCINKELNYNSKFRGIFN